MHCQLAIDHCVCDQISILKKSMMTIFLTGGTKDDLRSYLHFVWNGVFNDVLQFDASKISDLL